MDNLTDLIDISTRWSNLGSAIQDQAEDVVRAWHNGDEDFEETVCEQNVNALAYFRRFLEDVSRYGSGDLAAEADELNRALEAKGIDIRF